MNKDKPILTVFIPTFNRAFRLEKSLQSLINIILQSKAIGKVEILIGVNKSDDNSIEVCHKMQEYADEYGIKLSFYENYSNLGFNLNVFNGVSRISTDWMLFFSDDDNLYSYSISEIIETLEHHNPELVVLNFNQHPYTTSNPLYSKVEFFQDCNSLEVFRRLVSWPKFAGVVLKKFTPVEITTLSKVIKSSGYFAHIILAIHKGLNHGRVLFSPTFVGEPDTDYLDHVNFPWYTGASMREELSALYLSLNTPFTEESILDLAPTEYGVFESSVTHLIHYYGRRARISHSVKRLLWSNIRLFLSGKKMSADCMRFEKLKLKSFMKLVLLFSLAPISLLYSKLFNSPLPLMHDGF